VAALAALTVLGAGTAPAAVSSPVAAAVAGPVTGDITVSRHSAILSAMTRAADYYRPTYAVTGVVRNGWSWSTYFDGVMQLYRATGDDKYLTDLRTWGTSNNWAPQAGGLNPDSVKAGQTYYDIAGFDPIAALGPMDAKMRADLTGMSEAQYYWIDALFMGLPNWARWSARTGDRAYLAKLDALYAATRDNGITTSSACAGKPPGLYDAGERLWYRDCRFIGRLDPNGKKIFWSRGNGWVIAAMAEVLQVLPPNDPRAATYRDMLVGMADRLRTLQGSDGSWRSSLLDGPLHPQAETSGTALITYAIGYGVNAGLLDRATYVPVLNRAWNGLVGNGFRPNGFLTGCQPVGDQPAAPFTALSPSTAATGSSAGSVNSDSPPFCVGAFLLAGSQLAKLTGPMSTRRPVTASAQQVGNEAPRAVDGDITTRWSAKTFPQTVTVDLGANYRATSATLVQYPGRAYRYRIETSPDGVTWTTVVDRTANTAIGTVTDAFGAGAVNARHARLTVTGVAGNVTDWVSVREFSVHDRYDPRANLGYRHPATATSSDPAHPASAAVDNTFETYWSSAVTPTAAAPQTLTTDLGTTATIDSVDVVAREGFGPSTVAVLSSTDGTAWTTLATSTLTDTEGPHLMIFPPVPARWVRLRITGAHGATAQVKEFEAFAAH
jgi:rhamnogalacturonyl hydrolase YesR